MNTISKAALIKHFKNEKKMWSELKNEPQNMVHDEFIDDVLTVLGWVLHDIKYMETVPNA